MEKKKINMFPSPEDMEEEEAWGEFFRNQFRKDSKRWESEMERRKEIRNIDASPELFDRIVEQLKKEGSGRRTTRKKKRRRICAPCCPRRTGRHCSSAGKCRRRAGDGT